MNLHKKYFSILTFLLFSSCISSCKGDSVIKEVDIQEEVNEYIPIGTVDKKADIKLEIKSATASSCQPGMGIQLTIDGNRNTIYNSGWDTTVEGYFPIEITYSLEDVDYLDYFIYYPRLVSTGTGGNFQKFEVWTLSGSDDEYVKSMDLNFHGSSIPSLVSFPKRIENPKAVKFVFREMGVVCSEMEFYKKREEADFDIASIFADNLCSELIPGITKEDIENIPHDFFKNLAYAIYTKQYPQARIQSYKPYIVPEVIAKKYKIGTYSQRDNPTGIFVEKDDDLVVFVDDMKGRSASLLVQDLEKGFGGESYPLVSGLNAFKMKFKGLVYVIYYTETGSEEPIKMNIASGKVNGVFRKGGTVGEWNKMLDNAVDKHLDVVGEHAHLAFPVESFRKYCTDGTKLIELYDRLVELEKNFMGVEIPNRMYFMVSYEENAYMYATGYRTVYHLSTMPKLCDVNALDGNNIWGPAHEVGHINQTSPGFKWAGMTEVSNNVHSLYVQTSLGFRSTLSKERKGYSTVYELALNTILVPKKAHVEDVKEFFGRLVPFWQLQLYYANVKKDNDFYKKIYAQVREESDPSTDGECQVNFVRLASIAAGEDLTDFFEAWGLFVPINTKFDDYGEKTFIVTEDDVALVKRKIEDLGLSKPKLMLQYITDNNVELFKNPGTIQKGEAKLSNQNLTMSNWKNVVAYEIVSGGKLVYVSFSDKVTLPSNSNSIRVYAVAADGARVKVDIK